MTESSKNTKVWENIQNLDFIQEFTKENIESIKEKFQKYTNDSDLMKQIQENDLIKSSFQDQLCSQIKKTFMKIMTSWIILKEGQQDLFSEDCKQLIKLTFWLTKIDLLDANKALQFVEDVFDSVALNDIRQLFELIEEEFLQIHQKFGKEQTIKNSILKMCNTLFKKLSRTLDVDIRGRLHIFLTKILPLCHPSGRNYKSLVNPNNQTHIESNLDLQLKQEQLIQQQLLQEINEQSGSQQQQQQSAQNLDVKKEPSLFEKRKNRSQINLQQLYQRFWALQKYFHQPSEIFKPDDDENLFYIQKLQEKNKMEIEEEKKENQVIETEKNQSKENNNNIDGKKSKNKEETPSKKKEEPQPQIEKMEIRKVKEICNILIEVITWFKSNPISESGNTANQRYPKFLTTSSLLEIQFKDAFFRKIILVQSILFFYSLKSDKKFTELQKEQVQVLNDAEEKVKQSLKLICRNLKESSITDQVQYFIQQEKLWSGWKQQWKNDKQEEFFGKPEQSPIFEAIEYYKKVQKYECKDKNNQIENEDNDYLTGVKKDRFGNLINIYCEKQHDMTENNLNDIRKTRKVLDIALPTSNVRSIFKDDGYKYQVNTYPIENLPSVLLNPIYEQQKYGELENDFSLLKKDNYVWKSLRRVAKFDIALLKPQKKLEDDSNFGIMSNICQQIKNYDQIIVPPQVEEEKSLKQQQQQQQQNENNNNNDSNLNEQQQNKNQESNIPNNQDENNKNQQENSQQQQGGENDRKKKRGSSSSKEKEKKKDKKIKKERSEKQEKENNNEEKQEIGDVQTKKTKIQ